MKGALGMVELLNFKSKNQVKAGALRLWEYVDVLSESSGFGGIICGGISSSVSHQLNKS